MILLECAGDCLVHLAELRPVALVENDDEMLRIDGMILLFFNENGKFLNGCNDNAGVRLLKLAFQDGGAGVAVGGAFFEAVVLFHRLIVEVFSVDDKEHFVDKQQAGSKLGGFE